MENCGVFLYQQPNTLLKYFFYRYIIIKHVILDKEGCSNIREFKRPQINYVNKGNY